MSFISVLCHSPKAISVIPFLLASFPSVVGGTPVLSLAKTIILWLMFISTLLWGREEIGLLSHEWLQIMGLQIILSCKLWVEGFY